MASSTQVSETNTTGKLIQRGNKTKVEWSILGFSDLSAEPDDFYMSDSFIFSDAWWSLKIYPFGQAKYKSEGRIGLYVIMEEGFFTSVTYTMCLKKADGTSLDLFNSKKVFERECGWGSPKSFERSQLMDRKSELLPSDVLTLQCTLKVEEDLHNVGVSLFERLVNVSRNLKSILTTGQRSDVVLKLNGKEVKAHRAILETRSKVFAAMLNHDMMESRTGEINIEDSDADVFQVVLSYIYCGRMDNREALTNKNVREVYAVADKYDLEELKKLCVSYMVRNMSNDLFCDAFAIAETYSENYLKEAAVKHFSDNTVDILDSEEWNSFQVENSNIAAPFLVSILKRNASKEKTTS